MIAKKELTILTLTIFLLTATLIFQSSLSISKEEQEQFSIINITDYKENAENIINPERGFYNPIGYNLKVDDNKPLNSKSNLIHLRVGIGAFSSKNNNQEDLELTEDALNALMQTFQNIRDNNSSIILRFAYDNFDGKADKEPSLDMILTHIEQIGPILLKYPDVIANIELGFFGPWGEMHSSEICTNENVSIALKKLLEVTEEKFKISVRTPGYYANFRQIDRNILDTDFPEKGTAFYQIGIYNDGYLGSETDLGTFANREIEVKWLSSQAKHTFYGGELVANFASGTPLNTIEYLSKEAFLTHTTYLNPYWNDKVMEDFKTTPYPGEDLLYNTKSAYQYIENHLGYRFVLRGSYILTKEEKTDPSILKIEIENVGFANLIRDKKVSILLKNQEQVYELNTDLDATTWDSQKITEEILDITLPDAIKDDTYQVYLRISEYGSITDDNNYHCIQFANDNIYDKNLGANYIGEITIKNQTILVDTTPSTPSPSPTNTPINEPTPSPSTTLEPTPSSTPPSTVNNNNSDDQNGSSSTEQETITSTPTPTPIAKNKKYQIYYYYDNIRDTTKTLTLYGQIGTIIDSYSEKTREGYILDKTENYPLTISENVNENIIKIYYIKESEKEKNPEETPSTSTENENEDKIEDSKSQGQGIRKEPKSETPVKKNHTVTIGVLILDGVLLFIIMLVTIRFILKIKNKKTY